MKIRNKNDTIDPKPNKNLLNFFFQQRTVKKNHRTTTKSSETPPITTKRETPSYAKRLNSVVVDRVMQYVCVQRKREE